MSVAVAGIAAYLILHPFTPGRALFALKGLRAAATLEEQAALADVLDAVTKQARLVRKLNRQWRAGRKLKKGREGLMELDAQIDRLLAALCEVLKRLATSLPDGPLRKAAQALLDEHYPNGSAALIRLPLEEELDEAEALLETLQAEENQDNVRALGLGIWRDQLAEVLPAYDAAIRQRSGNPLLYSEVRAARAELNERLAELFVTLLARSIGQPEVRTRLGAPIQAQHDKISAAYRERVRPKEVDEHSGDELESPEEPEEEVDEPPVA